ncbi:MAG TPA: hypothetical protein VIM33_10225 [Gaiellaceae bacterium]|jgi:hypothetical protein
MRCSLIPWLPQDGIQAGGGKRITFLGLEDSCTTANNSAFFLNGSGIEDIVCDGCSFRNTNLRNTVFVASSLRSGARNSLICGNFRKSGVDVVDVNNLAKTSAGLPSGC